MGILAGVLPAVLGSAAGAGTAGGLAGLFGGSKVPNATPIADMVRNPFTWLNMLAGIGTAVDQGHRNDQAQQGNRRLYQDLFNQSRYAGNDISNAYFGKPSGMNYQPPSQMIGENDDDYAARMQQYNDEFAANQAAQGGPNDPNSIVGMLQGGYNKLSSDYQSGTDAALQEIRANTADVMRGYQDRENAVLGDVANVGTQSRRDINAGFNASGNRAAAQAAARGMGNSTLSAGVAALNERERTDALNRQGESESLMRGGFRERLSGDRLREQDTRSNLSVATALEGNRGRNSLDERGLNTVVGATERGKGMEFDNQRNWMNTMASTMIPYPSQSPMNSVLAALGSGSAGYPRMPGGGYQSPGAMAAGGYLMNTLPQTMNQGFYDLFKPQPTVQTPAAGTPAGYSPPWWNPNYSVPGRAGDYGSAGYGYGAVA